MPGPLELELDHVFVCAPRAHEDFALLRGAGLSCGVNRIHGGQGTANANFYFDNAYLELLWLHDAAEVRSAVVSPMALWERLTSGVTGACPFGVGFRALSQAVAERFSTWKYAAPFLPRGEAMSMVSPRASEKEPLVFLSRASAAPVDYPPEMSVPLEQKGKRRRLRKVHIQTPTGLFSPEVGKVIETGLLSIERGKAYHMELEFDTGPEGENLDFQPALPLSIRW
jgi:Glyoxalase-like domain